MFGIVTMMYTNFCASSFQDFALQNTSRNKVLNSYHCTNVNKNKIVQYAQKEVNNV